MKSTVSDKAGLVWVVSLLFMTMALFTNVDSAIAGGKKGPLQQTAKEGAEAADKFDSAKWLELYKKNGWEKKKFVNTTQRRPSSIISGMSPELKALHQKLEGESKMIKLRNRKVQSIRPFKNSQKVSELQLSGKIRNRTMNNAAGTTTILLNGSEAATISVGQSLEITINLTGDTAWVRVFWDANNNQIIDAGDFDLFEGEGDNFIVDNGFDDEDPNEGVIKLTLFPGDDEDGEDDLFLLLGDNAFLFEADDGAAADTAALWINSVSSSFSVSGSVDGYENVLIWAQSCNDEFCFDFGPDGFALTSSDASGNYTINLPTSVAGWWMVGAVDVFDITGGLFPSPAAHMVFVIGAETGKDFMFVTGDATIVVTLSDESGNPLEGVLIFAESFGFAEGAEATTNSAGGVSFEVIEGEWYIFVEPSDLLPDYLVPYSEVVTVASGNTEVVSLTAFTNDAFITGLTNLNDVPTGGFTVSGFSDLGYTEAVSMNSSTNVAEGFYSLPVSSDADGNMPNGGYCVSVCHLSSDQFVAEDHYNIQSGTDNIDIFVLEAEGYIDGTVYEADSNNPIPWADVCAGDGSDTSEENFNCRNTDESGYYEIPVQNGTYVVIAYAPGYQMNQVNSVVVSDNRVTVDFSLEKGDAVCSPNVWSVNDVPNDQGREVLVTWQQACLDFGEIEFYSLWRLPDELGMAGAPTHLTTIPEAGFEAYSKTAATLGDSIAPDDIWWSSYVVIAHSKFDDIFIEGSSGSGYSVDNLIPSAPVLTGSPNNGGVSLSWTEIQEEEANYYTVYKMDVTAGGSFEVLADVTETAFEDLNTLIDNSYGYYVTATDFANNEGEISNTFTIMVTSIDNLGNAIPDEYALGQNYPNPFNPTTSIIYQLPVSGNVTLRIYNLNGELVNTLVNGEMAAGYHTVKWNGLTSTGRVITSGVYLYKIQAGDFVQVRKMIMMK